MKITRKLLVSLEVCDEGLEYFDENKLEDIDVFGLINQLIDENKFTWINWLLARVYNHDNCIRYAIYAAESVLHIFEDKYPDDMRPRQAIEAIKNLLFEQSANNDDIDYAIVAAADACVADCATAYNDIVYTVSVFNYVTSGAGFAIRAIHIACATCLYDDVDVVSITNIADAANEATIKAKRKDIQAKIIIYGIKLLKQQLEDIAV